MGERKRKPRYYLRRSWREDPDPIKNYIDLLEEDAFICEICAIANIFSDNFGTRIKGLLRLFQQDIQVFERSPTQTEVTSALKALKRSLVSTRMNFASQWEKTDPKTRDILTQSLRKDFPCGITPNLADDSMLIKIATGIDKLLSVSKAKWAGQFSGKGSSKSAKKITVKGKRGRRMFWPAERLAERLGKVFDDFDLPIKYTKRDGTDYDDHDYKGPKFHRVLSLILTKFEHPKTQLQPLIKAAKKVQSADKKAKKHNSRGDIVVTS